jgi:predicted permease
MKIIEFVSTVGQDLRYGIRFLAKSPGFTAVAVLTLALGIGTNTAIFSLIEAVLLRALPVQDPQRLVVLEWRANKDPKYGWYTTYGDTRQQSNASKPVGTSFSRPFIQEIEKAKIFEGVAAFAGGPAVAVSGNGPATMGQGQLVNGDFFRTLGIQAASGRLLGAGDDGASASPAVVLSYAYWQRNFAGSPNAIGKAINLNGMPFTIVGVAEAKFSNLSFGNVYDFWIPAAMAPRLQPAFRMAADNPTAWWLVPAGRLKPGTSAEQAQAALDTMFRNEVLHGDKPLLMEADEPHLSVRGAQATLLGQSTQLADPLAVLMGAVGIILLIACANVAGLMLSRATSRRREIAVRLALGAGRGRLLRQLLTEAMLLGLIGGAAGIMLAIWCANGIVAMLERAQTAPLGLSASIDMRALAFTGGISLLAGILCGLAPAWRSLRVGVIPALKASAGTPSSGVDTPHRWLTLGNGLVILQTALAVVVLMGAGLLVHTLSNLKKIDPGFDTRNILTFALQPGLAGYKLQQTDNLYRQLKEDISGLPGVASVGYSEAALLSGTGTFGECLHCGQEIGPKRLGAPWTPYCITCQELLEEYGT